MNLTHQVRPNGQHRVLASDGRWRQTHHHVSPRRNLIRPGDRVIDQRGGQFRRSMIALTQGISQVATTMMMSLAPAIRRAVNAMAEFEKAQARAKAAAGS